MYNQIDINNYRNLIYEKNFVNQQGMNQCNNNIDKLNENLKNCNNMAQNIN